MREITQFVAFELVGRTINQWSMVECQVDDVIQKTHKLTHPQSVIICKSLSMWKKIEILKSLVKHSSMSIDEKTSFGEKIKELEKLSEQRNIIAHCIFVPNDDNTKVRFFNSKKIEISHIFLSMNQFYNLFKRLGNMLGKLEHLEERLAETDAQKALAEANPFAGL